MVEEKEMQKIKLPSTMLWVESLGLKTLMMGLKLGNDMIFLVAKEVCSTSLKRKI